MLRIISTVLVAAAAMALIIWAATGSPPEPPAISLRIYPASADECRNSREFADEFLADVHRRKAIHTYQTKVAWNAETSFQVDPDVDGLIIVVSATRRSRVELWADDRLIDAASPGPENFVLRGPILRGVNNWTVLVLPARDAYGSASTIPIVAERCGLLPAQSRKITVNLDGANAIVTATAVLDRKSKTAEQAYKKAWQVGDAVREAFPPFTVANRQPLWSCFDDPGEVRTVGDNVTWSVTSRPIPMSRQPEDAPDNWNRWYRFDLELDSPIDPDRQHRDLPGANDQQTAVVDVDFAGHALRLASLEPPPAQLSTDTEHVDHAIYRMGAEGENLSVEAHARQQRPQDLIGRFVAAKDWTSEVSDGTGLLPFLLAVLRALISVAPLIWGTGLLAGFASQNANPRPTDRDMSFRAMRRLLSLALVGPMFQMVLVAYNPGVFLWDLSQLGLERVGKDLDKNLTGSGGGALGVPLLAGAILEFAIVGLVFLIAAKAPWTRKSEWLVEPLRACFHAGVIVLIASVVLFAVPAVPISPIWTPLRFWPAVAFAGLLAYGLVATTRCIQGHRWIVPGACLAWLILVATAVAPHGVRPVNGLGGGLFWPMLERTSDLLSSLRSIALILMAVPALRYLYVGGQNRSTTGLMKLLPLGLVLFATFAVAGARPLAAIPIDFVLALIFGKWILQRPREESDAIRAVGPKIQADRGAFLDATVRYFQAARFRRALEACEKKLVAGDMKLADYQAWEKELNAFEQTAIGQEKLEGEMLQKDLALAIGPKADSWLNGIYAAKLGALLAAPMIGFYLVGLLQRGTVQVIGDSADPLIRVLIAIAALAVQWIVGALIFGYYFERVKGNSGLKKGFRTGISVALSTSAFLILDQPNADGLSIALIQSVFALCFYSALGVLFDREALRFLSTTGSKWAIYTRISGVARLAGVTSILVSSLVAGVTAVATKQLTDVVQNAAQSVVQKSKPPDLKTVENAK